METFELCFFILLAILTFISGMGIYHCYVKMCNRLPRVSPDVENIGIELIEVKVIQKENPDIKLISAFIRKGTGVIEEYYLCKDRVTAEKEAKRLGRGESHDQCIQILTRFHPGHFTKLPPFKIGERCFYYPGTRDTMRRGKDYVKMHLMYGPEWKPSREEFMKMVDACCDEVIMPGPDVSAMRTLATGTNVREFRVGSGHKTSEQDFKSSSSAVSKSLEPLHDTHSIDFSTKPAASSVQTIEPTKRPHSSANDYSNHTKSYAAPSVKYSASTKRPSEERSVVSTHRTASKLESKSSRDDIWGANGKSTSTSAWPSTSYKKEPEKDKSRTSSAKSSSGYKTEHKSRDHHGTKVKSCGHHDDYSNKTKKSGGDGDDWGACKDDNAWNGNSGGDPWDDGNKDCGNNWDEPKSSWETAKTSQSQDQNTANDDAEDWG